MRCRALLDRVLARPGWHGVMAYTLPEAIWLVRSGVTDDVLVAYPTVDRAAIAELATDAELAAAITADGRPPRAPGPGRRGRAAGRPPGRCGSAWTWTPPGGRPGRCTSACGARRCTPPAQAGALAAAVVDAAGLPAGRADVLRGADRRARRRARPARPLRGRAIRLMQRRLVPELLERRAAAVAAVREHADLEFVNGGGTGSVAATAADPAVTEVAAGSGLYGPTLFDAYRAGGRRRRRSSRCRWSAGPRRGSRRCSAAAGSPPARPSQSRLPHAVAAGRAAAAAATRAPARCRRRCVGAGGRRAAARRPGVVPPRQGRRAVRTRQRAAARRRRHGRRRPRRTGARAMRSSVRLSAASTWRCRYSRISPWPRRGPPRRRRRRAGTPA